ncbi:MAG: sulfatase modifying factor 1 [Maribacter sp.]|jgi:sulfatase modifying factor 1
MKNSLLFLFSIILISSCSHKQFVSVDNQEYEVSRPPNMVKIDNNLFADQTEISNMDWQEYVYWTKDIFGKNSDEHEAVLPDTTVWIGEMNDDGPRYTSYFSHSNFSSYPVVGVTYSQVKEYCEWRTNRVAEVILTQKGVLSPNRENKDISPFSLAEDSDVKVYLPTFRLPTETEWEKIASGGLDISQYPNGINEEKVKKKYQDSYLYNVVFPERISASSPKKDLRITAPVHTFLPNDYKIYNAVGNVAEMVEEQGVSKGGSFFHLIDNCKIKNRIIYAKPEKWLGFRCVAHYEEIQFKEG